MLRASSNSCGKTSFIAVSLCMAQTVPLAEQSSRLRGGTIDASSVTKDREGTRVWRFGGWGSVGEARGDTLAAGVTPRPAVVGWRLCAGTGHLLGGGRHRGGQVAWKGAVACSPDLSRDTPSVYSPASKSHKSSTASAATPAAVRKPAGRPNPAAMVGNPPDREAESISLLNTLRIGAGTPHPIRIITRRGHTEHVAGGKR